MNSVIIGAGFGDEGKGLITDFEARRLDSKLNVRFNGGAQAGHTVIDGNRRHVFGHVGAASFANADTYLSRDFLVNPLALYKELDTLKTKFGVTPNVFASVHSPVTTLYDMCINAAVEHVRQHSAEGNKKHGSCGMGINETVTRHLSGPQLTVNHLFNKSQEDIVDILHTIQHEWVPKRLAELNVNLDAIPQSFKELLLMPNVDMLADKYYSFRNVVKQIDEASRDGVVFEGAQGLMLDEFLGVFPYVTRSKTGMYNALTAATDLGVKGINPIYVTRAYATRHGAGPLDYEGHKICDKLFVDETNVFNQFQDHIRYAPLNVTKLKEFIYDDMNRAADHKFFNELKAGLPTLAITCLDQVGDTINIVIDDKVRTVPTEQLPEILSNEIELKVSHRSYGPCAKDVVYTSEVSVE